MTFLLDVNLLIALAWPTHVHHREAQEWFHRKGRRAWATCPLTQSGFIRISSNPRFIDGAVTPREARRLLAQVTRADEHQFWPDDLDWADTIIPASLLVGHRQVTDAYLLGLALHRDGCLATLDAGIESLLPPTSSARQHLEILARNP